ncbi:MAG: lanthionine synthetase LanC family protein [Polyangiaceae bacterium]
MLLSETKTVARVWPRSRSTPGLASGWEGVAWAELQTPLASARLRGLGDRLDAAFVRTGRREYCSGMIGLSARPVLAALIAKQDAAFAPRMRAVVSEWSRYLERSGLETDLMWGTTGALLCAAELETLCRGAVPKRVVDRLYVQTRDAARLESRRCIKGEPAYIGLSHGIAGYLLALEVSHAVFGTRLSNDFRGLLLEVIEEERYEVPGGGGLWPSTVGGPLGILGWCHGAPGVGLACLVGYALTNGREYRRLAKAALASSSAFPSSHHSFCCGAIGKAQVLVEGYRILGDRSYLRAARRAFREGAEGLKRSNRANHSFHGGTAGLRYLRQRIDNPRLPLLGLGPLSVAS